MTAAVSNFALKVAASPGHTVANIDMVTIYGNLSSLYLTVPSPCPYDVPFCHNTCTAVR